LGGITSPRRITAQGWLQVEAQTLSEK
jgi:hypothetical protein